MNEQTIRALAEKVGAAIYEGHSSGHLQIDGHRWDRWAVLRNLKEANPLVIWSGSRRTGRSIVCEVAYGVV